MEESPIEAGRYHILSEIGSGRWGAVYRIHDTRTDQILAMKRMRATSPVEYESFRHEFKILSQLRHPNIVTVYDFHVTADQIPFYTMEFIEGAPIRRFFDHLRTHPAVLRSVLRQICSALSCIHGRGIIHQDLKPENILISESSGDLVVKISDFGLADLLNETPETDGVPMIKGTYPYMSPEVLSRRRQDARSDLYSLGVVLYELISGFNPFSASDVHAIAIAHLMMQPPPLEDRTAFDDPALCDLVMQLLEKEAAFRPRSADAVLGVICEDTGDRVPAHPLLSGMSVGQEIHRRTIMGAFDAVREGHGRLIVISGAVGVGKTRLLDDVRADFQIGGAIVHDLTFTDIAENGHTVLGALLDGLRSIIAHDEQPEDPLIGCFIEHAPGAAWPAMRWRFRGMAEGFLRAMGRTVAACPGRPQIIVIRDFHTDEREPWSFLLEVADAWNSILRDDAPFLWLIETRSEIGFAAVEASSSERLGCMRIQQLSINDTAMLLGSMLSISPMPSNLVHQIHEITDGNALLITLVAQTLHQHDIVEWREGKWKIAWERLRNLGLTSDVSRLFEGLLRSLDDGRMAFLKHAALWSREFELRDLILTPGVSVEPAILMPGLIRDGFLVREMRDNRTVYRFRHPMMRSMLHHMIPESERKELHEAIAVELIRSAPDAFEEIAHHLFESSRGADAVGFAIRAAGKAQKNGQIRAAVDLYRRCLPFIVDQAPESRPRVHLELARCYLHQSEYHLLIDSLECARTQSDLMTGEFGLRDRIESHLMEGMARIGLRDHAAAVMTLREGMRFADGSSFPYLKLRITTSLAFALSNLKQSEQAIEIVTESIRLFPLEEHPFFAGILYATLANALYTLHRYPEAEQAQSESIRFGESVANPVMISDRYLVLGKIYHQMRNYPQALRTYAKALDLIRMRGDPVLLAETLSLYAGLKSRCESSETALQLLEEGVLIAEQTDRPDLVAANLMILAEVMIDQGKLDKAREHLVRAMDIDRKIPNPELHLQLLGGMARIAGRQGKWRQAIRYYMKRLDAARKSHHPMSVGLSYLFIANAYRYLAVFNRARFALNRARRAFEQAGAEPPDCDILEAEIYMGLDEIDKASALATRGMNRADQNQDGRSRAYASRVLGILCHKQGSFEKSHSHLQQSIEGYERCGEIYETGISRFALADLYRTLADTSRASAELERARNLFQHIGADYYLKKVETAIETIENQSPIQAGLDPMLSTFEQLTQLINSITDLDRLLGEILDVAIRFVHAERGMIILKDPVTGQQEIRVVRNLDETTSQDAVLISRTVLTETADSDSCVFTGNAAEDPRFSTVKSVRSYNILSLICVPLKNQNQLIGVIYVDSRRTINLFTERDRRFLQAFSNLAAATIDRSSVYRLQAEETRHLREEIEQNYRFDAIIGKSEAMLMTFKRIRSVIRSDVNVLLTGSSGTGKELAARAIHYNSHRKLQLLMPVNCAAIPETLVESELFGCERGAFTDAKISRPGKFEAADKGTLFLDEVGELPITVQAKLLRVIETKEVTRLGCDRPRKIDVRIIAATNRDLQSEIRAGRFREDLYYRLFIAHIRMPDLKDRIEDIPLLAQQFLTRACERNNRRFSQISPRAMEALMLYSWPGNVRELENLIESAVVFGNPPVVNLRDLPQHVIQHRNRRKSEPAGREEMCLEEIEKTHIQAILLRTRGNKSKACEILGVTRPTLDRKIKLYRLRATDPGESSS